MVNYSVFLSYMINDPEHYMVVGFYGGVTLSISLHPLMLTCTMLLILFSPLITSQHCLRGA